MSLNSLFDDLAARLHSAEFLLHAVHPDHPNAFTRQRKLPLPALVALMLTGMRKSVQAELDEFFAHLNNQAQLVRKVSEQAFAQARAKLSLNAIPLLNDWLIERAEHYGFVPRWNGLRLVAADASIVRFGLRASHVKIPLRHMYDEALEIGVPFLSEKVWVQDNKDDFDTSSALKERYNHYMSLVGWGGKSLGKTMNAHMAVYYAWRFAQIRRKQKGDQSLAGRIEGNEAQYRAERQKADREIAELTRKEKDAQRDVAQAEVQLRLYIHKDRSYYDIITPAKLKPYNNNIATAQQAHSVAQDELLRAKAKRDTMPGESDALIKNLEQYDAQLIADAQSLRDACLDDPARLSRLRPHYRGLLEAYENEFFLSKGLTDEKIFAFFENHIHDSLAGFATDSTLPSDPRVVYLGKDIKSQHAMNEKLDGFTEQAGTPA